MRYKVSLAVIFAFGVTVMLGLRIAEAKSFAKSFTSSFSGSAVTVPLDLDDNNSCGGPPFVCTDLSTLNTYSGKVTGGGNLAGSFTGQSIVELDSAGGTGCSINPGQGSCTLGTATDACLYTVVGSFANQQSATGDLTFGTIDLHGSSECIDFNSAGGFALPYPFSATIVGRIQGGTGKLANTLFRFTNTTSGQILRSDLQGHGFAWETTTSMGNENN